LSETCAHYFIQENFHTLHVQSIVWFDDTGLHISMYLLHSLSH